MVWIERSAVGQQPTRSNRLSKPPAAAKLKSEHGYRVASRTLLTWMLGHKEITTYSRLRPQLRNRLRLFDIKCAWFNEEQYCEFFPRTLLAPARKPPSFLL
jgi:hypothetical protein